MPLGVALCESVVSQPCKRNREVACLQRQSSTPTGSWLCCVLRGVDKLETVTVDFGTVRVDADCRREAGRVNRTVPRPGTRHNASVTASPCEARQACFTYGSVTPVTKTSLRDTPIYLILRVPFLPIGWELCVPVRTCALVAARTVDRGECTDIGRGANKIA